MPHGEEKKTASLKVSNSLYKRCAHRVKCETAAEKQCTQQMAQNNVIHTLSAVKTKIYYTDTAVIVNPFWE